MTKTYLDHLVESDREYHYRIKSVEAIDDEKMVKIENILAKYELRDITAPEKTIIQDHPLDFHDIQNAEVWIVDAVTGVPVSGYILQQELRANLKIPEKFIVVRTDNDPLELETARINADKKMRQDATEKGLTRHSLLDTDEVYPEDKDSLPAEDLYGDEHNSEFLKTLSQVAADRTPNVVEPKSGLFDWLDSSIGESPDTGPTDDFNDDYDTVKPIPWWETSKKSKKNEADKKVSPEGNYDEDSKTHRRQYEKEDGKVVDVEEESDSIRKESK